ncbi:MAG: Arc family DNA-binding protein [Janthinobacterium lividum]
MDSKKPSDLAERVVVRTPEGMRERLNDVARQNGRSANAEAVKALEAWLAHDPETEPAFVRLPERLRERVTSSASLAGRSVLEEIAIRLADSFGPVASPHIGSEQTELRAEIRDAVHEAIEGLLGNPEKLKLLRIRSRNSDGD